MHEKTLLYGALSAPAIGAVFAGVPQQRPRGGGAARIPGGGRFRGGRLRPDGGAFAPVDGNSTVVAPVVNVVWKF